MSRVLRDSSGTFVRLGEELGRGGEGSVYAIDRSNICAKVYHKPLSSDRASKIRLMISRNVPSLNAVASWPLDLLQDAKGQPVGLLMPRVEGKKDVHKLYSPKSRRADFLRADWRFLVRASTNISRAFAQVHQSGCVIGDVNHGSVLVAQDARVTLIDCDSFQIISGTQRFLCEVGVETYTPPELQGKSFNGIIRTPDHDNFGLAVLIFHLLMMGRHPFSGRYLGAGEMQIAKAIEERRFVYGSWHKTVQMERPPGAPDLSILGPETASLFEVAFAARGGKERPSAKEWVEALSRLEGQTIQCKSNEAHWHLSTLLGCPWCQMEKATGTHLFPFVVQGAVNSPGFDVATIAARLSKMTSLGSAPSISKPVAMPNPNAATVKKKRLKWRTRCVLFVAAGILIGIVAGSALLSLAAAGLAFVTYSMINAYDKELAPYFDAVSSAEEQFKKIEIAWQQRADGGVFEKKKTAFFSSKVEWDRLPQERLRRMGQLESDRRRLQLEKHLDSFHIEDATIPGIGRGRKDLLSSEGIESALDIVEQRLCTIPGFGPVMRTKLLDWRKGVERTFLFDPSKAIDPRDIASVEHSILMDRRRVESKLKTLADEAFQEHARVATVRLQLRSQVEEASEKFAQAMADLEAAR